MSESPYSFTGRFPLFRDRIVSDVILSSPDNSNPNSVKIRALWDTGCSQSIVSTRVADFLRLPRNGTQKFRSPFGGVCSCGMAVAKICVVLGGVKLDLNVGIADNPSSDIDCDITLGLDFITRGDFAITHDDGQLCLSFCYPPIGAPVDFTLYSTRLRPQSVVESTVIDESSANQAKLTLMDYFEENIPPQH